MRLTRRGEFIIMLIVNGLGVALLFLIAFGVPDAVWSTRAIYVVLGFLLFIIGNWFVVKWWGPNSQMAQEERVLGQERKGVVMRRTSRVLPPWALPATLVGSVEEAARAQDTSSSDWVAGVLARALDRVGGDGDVSGVAATPVEAREDDVLLTRRGEFISMLIVNNLMGLAPFVIFVTEPDALWPKKALHVVIGLLFLTIGNRVAVKWWGPNSRDAQLEREREQAGGRNKP